MKQLILAPCLICCMVLFAFCDDITYQYCIFMARIGAEYPTLPNRGDRTETRQPVKLTKLLIAPNTNYALYNITPGNPTERAYLSDLVTNNQARLIRSIEIINENDGQTGGFITRVETKDFNELPRDFYDIWVPGE